MCWAHAGFFMCFISSSGAGTTPLVTASLRAGGHHLLPQGNARPQARVLASEVPWDQNLGLLTLPSGKQTAVCAGHMSLGCV